MGKICLSVCRIRGEQRRCQSGWTPFRRWRRASLCSLSSCRTTIAQRATRAMLNSYRWTEIQSQGDQCTHSHNWTCKTWLLNIDWLKYLNVVPVRTFTSAVRKWGLHYSDWQVIQRTTTRLWVSVHIHLSGQWGLKQLICLFMYCRNVWVPSPARAKANNQYSFAELFKCPVDFFDLF